MRLACGHAEDRLKGKPMHYTGDAAAHDARSFFIIKKHSNA
ncbi:hypothetical protein [Treponema socranskii]